MTASFFHIDFPSIRVQKDLLKRAFLLVENEDVGKLGSN